MRQDEVRIGNKYQAKVSNKLVTVEVLAEKIQYNGRIGYEVKNLSTGRILDFRSALRLRPLPGSLMFMLDVTPETKEAAANLGTVYAPFNGGITKELARSEAVNLIHQQFGVGSWLSYMAQARKAEGLEIPGFGLMRIRPRN